MIATERFEKLKTYRSRYSRFEAPAFFTAGFLFDVLTVTRIDNWIQISKHVFFLVSLGWFLILQHKSMNPQWIPPKILNKLWPHQIRVSHFLFGNLLSAFVIFYFKSASLSKSGIFLGLVVLVMLLNEVPKVRALGLRFRLALFSFCLASFFIYFYPLMAGFLSPFLFILAVFTATLITGFFIYRFSKSDPDPRAFQEQFGIPVLAVQFLLVMAYFFKVIPPVPLYVSFAGIYHRVEKTGDEVTLYSLRPWYRFWSHGDVTFESRDSEPVYCYVRVFAPAQFSHQVILHWQLYNEKLKRFETQDRIPMQIAGGRQEGFRGYTYKSNFQSGRWRVEIETEDERAIGDLSFTINRDTSINPRDWRIEEG